MTTTLSYDVTTGPTTTAAPSAPATAPSHSSRRLWPYAGVAATVLGIVSTLFLEVTPTEADATGGAHRLVDAIKDGQVPMRVSCGIGILATIALLVFASGIQHRLEDRGLHRLTAARVLDKGMTAAAGAMFIGYGARAIMAGSLPNGVDHAFYSDNAREAIYAVLNNFPYLGWMGVAIAAGAAAVLAFRHSAFSKSVGIIGCVVTVIVGTMTLGLGLPYSAALAGPIFLLVASISLARNANA